MPWNGQDRRGKKRYGIKDAIVQYKKASVISFLAPPSQRYLVLNLSPNGMAFMTRQAMTEGQRLSVRINAPRLPGAIRAYGRVAWVRQTREQDAYRVGVEFTRVSSRARSLLKALLDWSVVDSIEISTRVYLKDLEKL